MKSTAFLKIAGLGESHPARGGWIEIVKMTKKRAIAPSPTPHGVGGLKCRG